MYSNVILSLYCYLCFAFSSNSGLFFIDYFIYVCMYTVPCYRSVYTVSEWIRCWNLFETHAHSFSSVSCPGIVLGKNRLKKTATEKLATTAHEQRDGRGTTWFPGWLSRSCWEMFVEDDSQQQDQSVCSNGTRRW